MTRGPVRFFVFVIAMTILTPYYASPADDDCLKWFNNSGIAPDSKNCIIKCDVLPKDMATFACAERCDEFCKSKPCQTDSYWAGKIKIGKPERWDLPTEISANGSHAEKQRLLELLSRLPDELKSVPFDGFYRMKKSLSDNDLN